ncbi:MAG: PKD domain-containing protein [Candidatus Lutacidiplasmatales archaeon]
MAKSSMRGTWSRPATEIGLVTLLVLSLLVPAGFGLGVVGVSQGASGGSARHTASAVHPPGLGISPRGFAAARPSAGTEYYTQEGATISQLNNSAATGVARLGEYVRLVTSPYSTAYELNGLSNSADWWQIVVAYNWPGCNSGFEEATEVWDSTGTSGAITCDSTLTLSAGDLVEFTIYFSSGNGCMGLRDVTTASSTHTLCQSQPDSGGTKWQFLSTTSDGNGYYTGPMTEVINQSALSCPDNTLMPRVAYEYANGTFVTNYVAWSDEFVYQGSVCYQTAEPGQAISAGDPASYYADTASGTSYGPHWVDGQNYSLLNPSYGFRFETDPTPITSLSVVGTPATPVAGQIVTFTATVSGGISAYQILWKLNGIRQPLANLSWTWRAGLAGTYNVVAYAIDQQNDVYGPSNTVRITVPGPLHVTGVNATPASGTDVGLAATFSIVISGGFGYWVVNWTGLPAGCLSANQSTISCSPTSAGPSNISASVHDGNGSMVSTGVLPYRVFPSLRVGLSSSSPAIDIGQWVAVVANVSGGSGGTTLYWSTVAGCVAQGSRFNCTPTVVAPLIIDLSVTDSAGASVPSGTVVAVNPTLTVATPAPRVLADVGVVFSARVTVSGGTTPFVYQWSGLPTGCSATGPVANCTMSSAFTYEATVQVRDAAGETIMSGTIQIVGAAAPQVALNSSGSPVLVGDSVTFTAATHGGTAPFSYRWTGLPSGCLARNSPTITCTPSDTGNYSVSVTATDSANGTATSSTTLAVQSASTPGGPTNSTGLSLGSELLWIVVLLAVAAAVAGAVVVARRRR